MDTSSLFMWDVDNPLLEVMGEAYRCTSIPSKHVRDVMFNRLQLLQHIFYSIKFLFGSIIFCSFLLFESFLFSSILFGYLVLFYSVLLYPNILYVEMLVLYNMAFIWSLFCSKHFIFY